eukprot:3210299-Ditylum_brightwellii.AAC.1
MHPWGTLATASRCCSRMASRLVGPCLVSVIVGLGEGLLRVLRLGVGDFCDQKWCWFAAWRMSGGGICCSVSRGLDKRSGEALSSVVGDWGVGDGA